MRRARGGDAGFALVEAMVALAIVATMAGLFYRVLTGTAQTAHALDDRRLAVLVAQSQLAAAEGGALRPGDVGESAGLHWAVSGGGPAADIRSGPLRLETLRVTIAAPGSARALMVLETLRPAR